MFFYYLRPCEKRQYAAHPLSSPAQAFDTKSGHPLPQGDSGFTGAFGGFFDSVAMINLRFMYSVSLFQVTGISRFARKGGFPYLWCKVTGYPSG